MREVTQPLRIEKISVSHWPDIARIQAEAYPDIMLESTVVLKSKWLAAPDMCAVCVTASGALAGYLLAHAWGDEKPPTLAQSLADDIAGTVLYIHDLAVAREFQGRGVARLLINHLFAHTSASGFTVSALVAVQGSCSFWQGYGYEVQAGVLPDVSYGAAACYMTRSLCG